jgi:hypothetical protein
LNRAVAISSIVRVIFFMLRIDLRRLSSARALAIEVLILSLNRRLNQFDGRDCPGQYVEHFIALPLRRVLDVSGFNCIRPGTKAACNAELNSWAILRFHNRPVFAA